MINAIKYPSNNSNVCMINMIEGIVREEFRRMTISDPVNQLITFFAEDELKDFWNNRS
jgi:hypothetical protein